MDAGIRGQVSGVRACRTAEIFDDPASAALFAEYERESANVMFGPCAPSREMYDALESTGIGQCFAAYLDGVLVGFAFVLNAKLPHFGRQRRFATAESLFVSGVARAGGLGGRLMNAVEMYCFEAGCDAVGLHAPVDSQLAKLMFLDEDRYVNTGYVFCRRLR